MRMQQMGGMQQMGMGGYFMPTMPQPQRFFTPAQIRAQPRWPQQQAVPRPGGMPGMGMGGMGMGGGVGPRGPRVGGPRVGQQQPRPMNQPGPQPMTMMARPGMPPVPMVGAQQVRPQQSFKYTPTARNPPDQECHQCQWLELSRCVLSRASSTHQQLATRQTRNATSANGWSSAGASSAELQVHTNSSQPARPGMPPVPMVGAQQVRPQQSFKYTPTARNP